MKSFKGCRNNVTGMPVFNNWSSNIQLDQLQSGVPFSMPCPSKRELPATSKRGKWGITCTAVFQNIWKYGIQTVWKLKQSRYKDIPLYQKTIKQPPLGYYKTAKCHFKSSLNQRLIYKHQMNIHPVVLFNETNSTTGWRHFSTSQENTVIPQ